MTARERVRSTQRSLEFVVGSSAIFWGAAALFAGLVLVAVINRYIPMASAVRGTLPVLAVLAGLGLCGWMLWQGRFAWSFDKVALWIEERAPELRYALVTAIDPRYADSVATLMEPTVSRVDTGVFVRKAAQRTTLPALAALLVTSAIFFFAIPKNWLPKTSLNEAFSGLHTPRVIGNRLTPLSGTLTPPAYTHLRTQQLRNPSTISGYLGSQVVLTGHGEPDGIKVTLGVPNMPATELPVTAGEEGWRVAFTIKDTLGMLLKLTDRKYQQLIVVDPRIDQAPEARLLLPARDTTLRTITGSLTLSAEFTDDIGLGKATFTYIIANTGEGDAAQARLGTLGTRELGGTGGSFSLTIPYSSLGLKEGDQLSVRAVILDNNTLTGPDSGFSETRTIRIARKSEYDSLSINAAPPSADTAIMSLRMLIIATEKLDKQKAKLPRPEFVAQSQKLAGQSEIVRQKIQRILDEQTGGGEIAANPLLTTALNAMWEATRSLNIAETGEAIPQMYIALKALKQYSNEKKYFPRGQLKVPLVNIDRVRMTGTDTGTATPRLAWPAVPSGKDRLRMEYTQAISYIKAAPDSAIATFTVMRVEALKPFPKLAAALGEAVTAIQTGKDATMPLLQARRELDGKSISVDTLPPWSGIW